MCGWGQKLCLGGPDKDIQRRAGAALGVRGLGVVDTIQKRPVCGIGVPKLLKIPTQI